MVHHGSESFSLPDFYCTSYSNCPGAVRQTTDFTPGCAWLRLAALGCAWLRLAALGAVVVADKGPRGENAAAWAFWRNKGPDYT